MSKKVTIIDSNQNKLIKLVKKLQDDKKYRDTTNLFVVDGLRIINTLVKNKYEIKSLIIRNDAIFPNELKELNFDIYKVNNQLFNSLSSLKNPDGYIALVQKQKLSFELKQNKRYVILDRIQNPGNLGTIIRTCLAFNIDGIIISNDSVDIYNPTLIRSSMGACLSIPIKVVTDLSNCINQLKSLDFKIYATALDKNATELKNVKPANSLAIIFGNEGKGLAKNIIDLANQTLYIPISSNVDSLNVSIAVGIVLYKLCE